MLASVLASYEGKTSMIFSGMFVVYLIYTATTTVKPLSWNGRPLQIALMLFAFVYAAVNYYYGSKVGQLPGHAFNGVPAGMILFLRTISLVATIGDFRMLREGSLHGGRRLARHLWRMCFGLFVATGSFFFGQMKCLLISVAYPALPST